MLPLIAKFAAAHLVLFVVWLFLPDPSALILQALLAYRWHVSVKRAAGVRGMRLGEIKF